MEQVEAEFRRVSHKSPHTVDAFANRHRCSLSGAQVYFKVNKRILPSKFPIARVLPSGDSAMEFSEPG